MLGVHRDTARLLFYLFFHDFLSFPVGIYGNDTKRYYYTAFFCEYQFPRAYLL